jgi:hypothetical protein
VFSCICALGRGLDGLSGLPLLPRLLMPSVRAALCAAVAHAAQLWHVADRHALMHAAVLRADVRLCIGLQPEPCELEHGERFGHELRNVPCRWHAHGLVRLGGGPSIRAVGAVLKLYLCGLAAACVAGRSCACLLRWLMSMPRAPWRVAASCAWPARFGAMRQCCSQMFYSASAFNQPIDVWNTARASSMYGVCSVTACVRTDQTRRRPSCCCA